MTRWLADPEAQKEPISSKAEQLSPFPATISCNALKFTHKTIAIAIAMRHKRLYKRHELSICLSSVSHLKLHANEATWLAHAINFSLQNCDRNCGCWHISCANKTMDSIMSSLIDGELADQLIGYLTNSGRKLSCRCASKWLINRHDLWAIGSMIRAPIEDQREAGNPFLGGFQVAEANENGWRFSLALPIKLVNSRKLLQPFNMQTNRLTLLVAA